jgi:peptidoglycan/LPS O-acetylase OafA/YrhL
VNTISGRLISFDVLRSIAITAVVLSHLHYFSSIPFFLSISSNFGIVGNGMFFFMSGFLLFRRNKNLTSWGEIKGFFARRFTRVYPLYWVVLIGVPLSIAFFTSDFSTLTASGYFPTLLNYSINILGLQILFPDYTLIPAIWFVGLIVLFYLIYPVIIHSPTNLRKMIIASLAVYLAFLIIHFALGIVDDRFFIYYFMFLTGIIFEYLAFFEMKPTPGFMVLLLSFTASCIGIYVLHLLEMINFSSTTNFFIFNIFINDAIVISGIILLYYGIQIHPIKNLVKSNKEIFYKIAMASYAIYLFQFYLLEIMAGFFSFISISTVLQAVLLIVVGIPFVFFISYCIHLTETKVINHFVANRQK